MNHRNMRRMTYVLAIGTTLLIFLYLFAHSEGKFNIGRKIEKVKSRLTHASYDSLPPEIGSKKKWYKYDALNWLAFKPESQAGKRLHSRTDIPSFKKEDIKKKYTAVNLGADVKHDKWIILTTIQAPTEDVKFLAKLEGWKVIVVGDTKTPPDWKWDNCHFLSVDFQEKMGLQLSSILPYRMYQRKNAGYLYAIAHGAKIIYETDDDNRPTDNLKTFQYTTNVSGLMFGGSKLFNAYQSFGQSTLWQRGYPLGKVGADVEYSYRVSSNWPTPVIQQGVVNGDPDMDGIFRLTRKMTKFPLEVTFDPAGPPIIVPPTVFSPYNTQNTLLTHAAFWSLYLPISLNFRTCDIWRGYVGQRLLWEIGGYLAFYPPNAYQQRNSHDLMTDTADEAQMYFTTEELLDVLQAWRCPEELSFFQCQYKLMMDLVDAGTVIFGEKEITGVQKWIEDIVFLGYEEPKRVRFESPENLKSEALTRGTTVYFAAAEQKDPTISFQPAKDVRPEWKYTIEIKSLCDEISSFSVDFISSRGKVREYFNDVLLIIYYPSAKYSTLRNLEIYYRSMFPNIAYCGHHTDQFLKESKIVGINSKHTFIEVSGTGAKDHMCTAKAIQMNYNVNGYLTIRDDVILDLPPMLKLNKDTIWTGSKDTQPLSAVIGSNNGKIQYDRAVNSLLLAKNAQLPQVENVLIPPKTFVDNQHKHAINPLPSDSAFYLPRRHAKSALYYISHFMKYDVAGELVVPGILNGLEQEGRSVSLHEMNVIKKEASLNSKTVCSMFLDQAKPTQ